MQDIPQDLHRRQMRNREALLFVDLEYDRPTQMQRVRQIAARFEADHICRIKIELYLKTIIYRYDEGAEIALRNL